MNCYFDTCNDAVKYTTDTRSFGIFYSEIKNQNPDVHIHECCEIFLCLEGGSSFLIDDKVYDMSDGDLFVINQFEAHKVVPDKGDMFRRYIMHVHPSFLHTNSLGQANLSACFYASKKLTKTNLSPAEAEYFVKLLEKMREEETFGDEIYKRIRATEILLEVGKAFSTHQSDVSGEFSQRTVQAAVDYINKNYSLPLTLEDVAKSAFVSPNQLSRIFSRHCGTTVTRYIISKRITEAKKLLLEGKSVTEAAFACGFNDYANFIRTFKKAVGIPPGKYKSNIK